MTKMCAIITYIQYCTGFIISTITNAKYINERKKKMPLFTNDTICTWNTQMVYKLLELISEFSKIDQ